MKKNIKRLQKNIIRLKDKIHHISIEELSKKENASRWSKKEILGHLIDSARYNLIRFNEIIIDPSTFVYAIYSQNKLVELNDYQNTNIEDLVILWQSYNQQMIRTLQKLSKKHLKISFQVDNETKNVEWLIDGYIKHLEYHLNQILSSDTKKKTTYHIPLKQAIKKLKTTNSEFAKVMEFADLEIEYYQPNKIDKQQPHTRDEVYIIAQGKGEFIRKNKKYKIKTHDVLFVKAHEEHRFINFSDDFATWVIFYGLHR